MEVAFPEYRRTRFRREDKLILVYIKRPVAYARTQCSCSAVQVPSPSTFRTEEIGLISNQIPRLES